MLDLESLEAALYLQRDKKSLEPLKRKIEHRFEEVLELAGTRVHAKDSVEEFIRYSPHVPINEPAASSLNEAAVSGTAKLVFSQNTATLTIVSRLLRALNDDRIRRQGAPLIKYANTYLPGHLEQCAESLGNSEYAEEWKVIGKGLVNFLRDPDSIGSAWDLQSFEPYEWLADVNIHAMQTILRNKELQDQLKPIERRWAIKNTTTKTPRAPFLRAMAETVASKWLVDRSRLTDASDCFAFIDEYLRLVRKQPV